tara:strand:+ start:2387 stop:2596 length:210 start_codon:yes stop_codon:yes gene_type:complete
MVDRNKNIKTYFDLLPDEIINLIYRKVLFSIIISREFQISQAWMYHKIITKHRFNKERHHYSYYIDDLL